MPIVNLPGSRRGAAKSLEPVLDLVCHGHETAAGGNIIRNAGHEGTKEDGVLPGFRSSVAPLEETYSKRRILFFLEAPASVCFP